MSVDREWKCLKMLNSDALLFSWKQDKRVAYLNILMISFLLGSINLLIPVLGILTCLFIAKYGKIEVFSISFSDEEIQVWYDEYEGKPVKLLPSRFFQNPIIEDHGKIFVVYYGSIHGIALDLSKTRLLINLNDNTELKIDIRGKGNFISDDDFENIRKKVITY